MMEKIKENEGITLAALIITIIVLLILAGVSMSVLFGENGIITKAEQASNEYTNSANEEEEGLGGLESFIDQYLKQDPFNTSTKVTISSTATTANSITVKVDIEGQGRTLGYKYYYKKSTESDNEYKNIQTRFGEYEITGLDVNTEYNIYVIAIDVEENQKQSINSLIINTNDS